MRLRVGLLLAACLLLGAGLLILDERGAGPADIATAVESGDTLESAPAAPGDTEQPPPVSAPAAPAPPPAGPPPQPDPNRPLPERLAALVNDPALQGGTVGVSVTTADGTPVFAHRADAQLLPASTEKLLVAAGALATLGPDFRYETHLRATALPAPGGVVDGDLVLVGGGDPALATPTYAGLRPDRPRTPLEALADRVVAGGITRITGGVIGDPRVFPHEPEAPGWLPRYLEEGDTSRSSGLTAEGGRRLFHEGGRLRSEPAADPSANAAAALHGLLTDRGVVIDGSAGSTLAPPPAPVHVGSVASPPMLELLRTVLQRSDNHLADAVFRTIGLASGDASWAGAAAATQEALSALDLDFAGTTLADGSGLSRAGRLSPALLTDLDVAMTNSRYGAEWQGLMAVAGESGTLQRRLVGSVAERRLRGKTGSLEDVVALSGVVVGPAGPRYHLAVVGNDLDRGGKAAVRQLQDQVVLALAEDLYGCTWEPAAPDAPPDTQWQLACAA